MSTPNNNHKTLRGSSDTVEPSPKRQRIEKGALKVVILVGGPSKGTRFRPLSLDIPKPLFPVAGKPLIAHHLSACAKLPQVKEIILLGFYDRDHPQWKEFIAQQQKELNINIRFVKEESTGTAGGLLHSEKDILEDDPSHFFVLHCDITSSFPLQELLEFHKKAHSVCTILGKKVPVDQAHKYGCLAVEPKTQALLHYAEKPETFVSDVINTGIYCFSPQIFSVMREVLSKRDAHVQTPQLIDRNIFSLEHHVLPYLADSSKAHVFESPAFWMQVKAPGVLIKCTEHLLAEVKKENPKLLATGANIVGNVVIHPGAKVDPSSKIGPNVTIGEGVVVGAGARIANSILLNNVEVQDRACILHSIIGWNSKVGKWARLEGTPDMEKASEVQNFGITILGGNVTVSSEVALRACVVLPNKELTTSASNQIIL